MASEVFPLKDMSRDTGSFKNFPQSDALLLALRSGDITRFTDLLREIVSCSGEKISIEHPLNNCIESEGGKTLLFVAIEAHSHSFVSALLEYGASGDLFNPQLQMYPLHFAAKCGDSLSASLLTSHIDTAPFLNSITPLDGQSALHIFARSGNVDGVRELLKHPQIQVDIVDGLGRTPLYLAVFEARSETVARELISHGASLSHKISSDGQDIYASIPKILPGLLSDTFLPLKTTTLNMSHKHPDFWLEELASLIENAALTEDEDSKESLLEDFKLKILFHASPAKLSAYRHNGGENLLEKACYEDLSHFVAALLDIGMMDANSTSETSVMAPLAIAATRANLHIIRLLLRHGSSPTSAIKIKTNETILHILSKRDSTDPTQTAQMKECLLYLLRAREVHGRENLDDTAFNSIKKIINKQDAFGNTALHHASRKWSSDVVRAMLECGANIGINNIWDETPISIISTDTMENFLDEFCLTSNLESDAVDVHDNVFQIAFNYSFLASNREDLSAPFQSDNDQIDCKKAYTSIAQKSKYENNNFLPETESMWYMSQSKTNRHLLNHPVIKSFLWLKWTRIRPYFNRNLRFFMLFVVILTWYIFETYGRTGDFTSSPTLLSYYLFTLFSFFMVLFILLDWIMDIQDFARKEMQNVTTRMIIQVVLSNWMDLGVIMFIVVILASGVALLWIDLIILLSFLIFRDLLKITFSLKYYLFSLENLIEMSTIALVFTILIHPETESGKSLERLIAATTIVLSWARLVTLVAKHPKLARYNVYVTMFYKVLSTFSFILLWYAFFILSFGLAFYILFMQDQNSSNSFLRDDGYIYFNTPWLSLIKTSTMFVGELEFSDIPIKADSVLAPLAYLFFLSFVFLIVVVLMNLLNGLAISDTAEIQAEAEIICQISQIETMVYIEAALLGDPIRLHSTWTAFRWVKRMSNLSILSQLNKSSVFKSLFHKITGTTGILLFHSLLPDKIFRIKPNERNNQGYLQVCVMDRGIILKAIEIIMKTTKKHRCQFEREECKTDHSCKQMKTIEKCLIRQKANLANIESKLDLLMQSYSKRD